MDILDFDDFAAGVESYGRRWTAAGVRWQLHRGPTDRDKTAAWVHCETEHREAELIVWSSGEAELGLADKSAGYTDTHYDVSDRDQLCSILDRITDHLAKTS